MISFRDFLRFAEKLYLEAQSNCATRASYPYIIGSILSSWMSIEAFLNSMMQDFTFLPKGKLSVHEIGFLEEKQVRFATEGKKMGTFQIEKGPDYRHIDEKIMFLIAKFGDTKFVDKGGKFWQKFERVKDLRNALAHPRRNREIDLTLKDAEDAMDVARSVIELVAKEVWRKPVKW